MTASSHRLATLPVTQSASIQRDSDHWYTRVNSYQSILNYTMDRIDQISKHQPPQTMFFSQELKRFLEWDSKNALLPHRRMTLLRLAGNAPDGFQPAMQFILRLNRLKAFICWDGFQSPTVSSLVVLIESLPLNARFKDTDLKMAPIDSLAEKFAAHAIDTVWELWKSSNTRESSTDRSDCALIIHWLGQYYKSPDAEQKPLQFSSSIKINPCSTVLNELAQLVKQLDTLNRNLNSEEAKRSPNMHRFGQEAYLSGCQLAEKLMQTPDATEISSLKERVKNIAILVKKPGDASAATRLLNAQETAPVQKSWMAARFGSAVLGVLGAVVLTAIAIIVAVAATPAGGVVLAGTCISAATKALAFNCALSTMGLGFTSAIASHLAIRDFTHETTSKRVGSFGAAEAGVFATHKRTLAGSESTVAPGAAVTSTSTLSLGRKQ